MENENTSEELQEFLSDNLEIEELKEYSNQMKNLNFKDANNFKRIIENLEKENFRNAIFEASNLEWRKELGLSEAPQNETSSEELISIGKYKNDFLNNITSENYKTFSSGIKNLDKIINGGFTNQTTCIIGGASNVGKSTFVLQIIDALLNDRPVIYFSLEMSKDLILSKILSRFSYTTSSTTSISNDVILTSSKENKAIQQEVNELLNLLPSRYNNLYIVNPKEPTLEEIEKVVKREIKKLDLQRAEYIAELASENENQQEELFKLDNETIIEKANEKYKAPILVLDYIQLIQPSVTSYGRSEDIATTIKKVNRYFHNYANDNNSISFMITAYNRETTENKQAISLGSGRDTSDLEYSADLMLGLNFREYEKEMLNSERAKLPSPNTLKENAKNNGFTKLSLVKVKDRKGLGYEKTDLDFYGKYSYFSSDIKDKEIIIKKEENKLISPLRH